jgi:two-component system sensor histidine kinase SenX3
MRKRRLRRRLAEAVRNEGRALERARQLSREATRLRLALEALPHSVIVWDEDRRVVLRNCPEPEGAGPRPGEALLDAAIEELGTATARSEPVTRTVELRGPPARQLMLRAMPLRTDGGCLGMVAVVDDGSDRQRLDAIRRDFVANVSHELRTPVGALALLGEALSGETDLEVVSRLAVRISAEADRAARMIEDLLDLSRIEGGGPMGHRPVAVQAVVGAAVERAAPVVGPRNVRVVTSTAGDAYVLGDEAQLVSAVANLIDNAVKYSDAGATVRVSAKGDDAEVSISVRDRGIGIPATDLERIFERFYRVDRARSRGTGGTGLGLSIVRHVATNHGGDIVVHSVEGKGSTFTLRLPVVPPSTQR